MSIKETEVEINLTSHNIKHFEKLGYPITRYKNKWGELVVKRGTKIWVKVSDLPPKSSVPVTAICENPNCPNPERILRFWQYTDICQHCYLHSEEHRLKSVGENNHMFGKTYEELYGDEKAKELKENMRKPLSDETKEKMSKASKGKPKSEEHKRKMRLSHIKNVEQKRLNGETLFPNFNRTGCMLIEQYGKEYGFNFQHALNGKELKIIGYFPDGYDKERNTIIEIDEPYHEDTKQKEKDVIRQKNLIEHLKCDFIRIKVDKNYNILDTIIFKYQPII